jgi:hypothetical protein
MKKNKLKSFEIKQTCQISLTFEFHSYDEKKKNAEFVQSKRSKIFVSVVLSFSAVLCFFFPVLAQKKLKW